ncbi:MAG TPA: hypothetical protein VFY93_14830 [Planctomycetota bacterium]|nr:hypothetical protein [Planctomycetota bacterium]
MNRRRELPPGIEEEYRREEEKRRERRLARRRATEARYLVEGVLLFALGEFLFGGLSAGRLLVLAVPGLALGWTCARLKVGSTGFTIAAAVAYAIVYGVFGFFALWHFIFFLVFASVAGLMHSIQRADGSEGM